MCPRVCILSMWNVKSLQDNMLAMNICIREIKLQVKIDKINFDWNWLFDEKKY